MVVMIIKKMTAIADESNPLLILSLDVKYRISGHSEGQKRDSDCVKHKESFL